MPGAKHKLLDRDLIDELISYIEVGNYVPTACAAVGVSTGTYYRWLGDGQNVEDIISPLDNYDELKESMLNGELIMEFSILQTQAWVFRERVLQAAARSEAYAVATIRKQMPQQWTAAMTFLERRFPNRWKRREQIDVGEADAGGTGIDETLLLQDPHAVKLIHDALDRVAKGEIEATTTPAIIDATVVEDDTQSAVPSAHSPASQDDEKPRSD